MIWGINKIFYIIVIPVILFNTTSISAQNSLVPAARAHYGLIHPHAQDLVPYAQSKPFGIELEWNWQLMGRDAWNYCFCYPRTGVSFFYINFNNPRILGSAYSTYLFIEPVLGASKKLHTSLRFGLGPAYMDKVYDAVTNPENTFYSSHLSFILVLSGGLNYRFNEKLNLRAMANFNHISNGGIKNPNRGINFSTYGIGVDYYLRAIPFETRIKVDTINLIPYKWKFGLAIFATGKTDIKGQHHYPVFGLYAKGRRVVGRIYAIAPAIELTIDLADKHEIERLAAEGALETVDHKYAALLLGPELLIGRFSLNVLFGVYIYAPFKRLDPIYQRYGLDFNITEKIFTGINLKAHRHVADFLDFRIGYSF